MARSSCNLSNSFGSNLELRIERLERICNSLEARLISLTTLIRTQCTKIESSGDVSFEKFASRIEKLEADTYSPAYKIEEIEKRLEIIEKRLISGHFKKTFEDTHEKIKNCMDELKENLKVKEREYSEKLEKELLAVKDEIKTGYRIIETNRAKGKKEDEIDKIIKELQERLKNKTPCRSDSLSIIRNKSSTPRSTEKQSMKVLKKKKSKKIR